jgi:hypothetical protein
VEFLPWVAPEGYAHQYRNIDVMLCPLMRNQFNKYRSPIKVLECSRTGTAILAENYGPYQGAGQIKEGGWNMLPEIVRTMQQQPVTFQPSMDPHLFSEKPDGERVECIKNLCRP